MPTPEGHRSVSSSQLCRLRISKSKHLHIVEMVESDALSVRSDRSGRSGTSTLVNDPAPDAPPPDYSLPTSLPMPGFSTRAYTLYSSAGSSITQQDYNDSTFSIMIKCGQFFEMPLIISVDETFEGLLNDIKLLANSQPLGSRQQGNWLKFLRVDWDGHSSRFASLGGNIQWGRQRGEMMAMLRLLKQRGGIDRLVAS